MLPPEDAADMRQWFATKDLTTKLRDLTPEELRLLNGVAKLVKQVAFECDMPSLAWLAHDLAVSARIQHTLTSDDEIRDLEALYAAETFSDPNV